MKNKLIPRKIKKCQEGNLIIPQINENSIDKDYVQSYFIAKDKNYFIKDWLNKRKNILEKNISNNSNVNEELQKQLNNLNSVKEYSFTKDMDFMPYYTKSSWLRTDAMNQYFNDFSENLDYRQSNNAELLGENMRNHFVGAYYPNHTIGYTETNPSAFIHERTHSLKADAQKNAIEQLNLKLKDSYYDNPSEIYSRLMEFRYANKLNPNKIYTIEDVKKFKEDPNVHDFELLDRYSEEDVLKLLNEIAYNNTNKSINIAKKGCKL